MSYRLPFGVLPAIVARKMPREAPTSRWRAALTLAAAVGALVAASAQAAPRAEPPDDFSVIAKVTHAKTKGDDTAVFREVVKADGRRIGKAKLKLRFRKRIRFAGRWRLEEGTIEARGRARKKGKALVVPIVDGSGLYKGGTGKVRIESVTKRRNRETFDFERAGGTRAG
jgi:hypothetical protein